MPCDLDQLFDAGDAGLPNVGWDIRSHLDAYLEVLTVCDDGDRFELIVQAACVQEGQLR